MTAHARSDLPDFNDLYTRFEKLPSGARADLRRLAGPDDVWRIPGAYRLLPPGQGMTPQWQRVIFMLPQARRADAKTDVPSLGRQFADAGVSEMRLFQVVRSEEPNDLLHLRRLIRHADRPVDWQELGRTLFLWGDVAKRMLAEQYFLAVRDSESTIAEPEPESADAEETTE